MARGYIFAALLFAAASAGPDSGSSASAGYLSALVDAEQRLNRVAARLASNLGAEERRAAESERVRVLQQLGVARSMVGDYAGATAAFHELLNATPSDQQRAMNDKAARELASQHSFSPAIAAIVREAMNRQVVILNEAHHVPRHRAFAQLLAIELRKIGFEYLACEAFSDGELVDLRYPTTSTGHYTREPLFGDFVRQSIRLGFKPVAYDFVPTPQFGSLDQIDRINERESAQARNLVDRIFRENPKARVLVYVGYAHLLKGRIASRTEEGRWIQWMAGRLKESTGLDPLTIDQTTLSDPAIGTREHALLKAVFGDTRSSRPPQVMQSKANPGLYSSLGSYAGDVDMQVLHPPSRDMNGRPDWLRMGGYREPHRIPASLAPLSGRTLIQAFFKEESEDAIPVDQILVDAKSQEHPVLMLPKGEFRFSALASPSAPSPPLPALPRETR